MLAGEYRPRSLRAMVNWRRHLTGPRRISLPDLWYCWKNNLYAARSREYDLVTYEAKDFYPDTHIHSPGDLDPDYQACVEDKSTFYLYMQALGAPTPRILAERAYDRVIFYDPEARSLEDLILRHGPLIIKPRNGHGGQGVRIARDASADLTLNSGEFVSTKLSQHPYAAAINPESVNTLRILTAWDPARREPFIAAAAHRFGTAGSDCVDNWSRGGLSASIDLETGRLGPALRMPTFDLDRTWWKTHPDTGAPIEGVEIPRLRETFEALLAVCERFPPRYLGWDIVITPDSWAIIEANSLPCLGVFQVHRPLLLDARLRAFFQAEGLI